MVSSKRSKPISCTDDGESEDEGQGQGYFPERPLGSQPSLPQGPEAEARLRAERKKRAAAMRKVPGDHLLSLFVGFRTADSPKAEGRGRGRSRDGDEGPGDRQEKEIRVDRKIHLEVQARTWQPPRPEGRPSRVVKGHARGAEPERSAVEHEAGLGGLVVVVLAAVDFVGDRGEGPQFRHTQV